jgi:hypothetical protein
MQNRSKISRQMARKVGSVNGYQILTIRRPRKNIPDWVNNNREIQRFLLVSFPLMRTDSRERIRAGQWARIINLYFKRQWSRGQIAEELNWTYERVNGTIRSIKRAAENKACRNGAERGSRSRVGT